MNKKHIITIAGKLGSGKSSTAKKVAEILGYKHLSTGDFMRVLAQKRNITLEEFSEVAEKDLSIDEELDNFNKEIQKEKDVVLDSRLGFHFIPDSFKVFLELSPKIAALRILKDKETNPNRHNEAVSLFNSQKTIITNIKKRLKSEQKRYKELYKIKDHTSHKNFNLIINTAKIPLEEVSQKIVEEYKKWLNQS